MAQQPGIWKAALLALLLATAAPAPADVSIEPAFLDIRLDEGRPAGRFVITNASDREVRYRVQASHFIYTMSGGLELVPADQHSLAPWLKFNPREFALAANSRRVVRFIVMAGTDPAPGEYWAAMELESLQPFQHTASDGRGRSFKVDFISSVLVPIFGRVGDVAYTGEIEHLEAEATDNTLVVSAQVANVGDGRMRLSGTLAIVDASGTLVAELEFPGGFVLAGARRRFNVTLDQALPVGDYSLRLTYNALTLPAPLTRDLALHVGN